MSASHRKKYNQEPKSSSRTQCNAIPLAPLRCVSRCLLLSQRWCIETDSFRGFTMGFLIQKVGLKGFKLDSDIQEIKDERNMDLEEKIRANKSQQEPNP